MRIILLLLISFSAFAQTQISGTRIKPGTLPPEAGTDAWGRPINDGALTAPYEVTFDEVSKTHTLAVTSDIALTLAASGNVAYSRIYITASGDGIHNLTWPGDWDIDEGGETAFNPNAVNKIQLDYDGEFVTIKISHRSEVIISTLDNAVMSEGTDDLNLSFSSQVTITTAGWSITASGGAVTVSSVVSGSGTANVVFDLSRNITSGEEMSISYNPTTGNTVSSTNTEIAAISNFFVDTGEEALPSNSITVDDSGGKDYTTITAGVNAAVDGQTVVVYAGTYRETIPGKTGVTVQPATGETVIVSGLNEVGNSGWTLHSGSIYYKVVTPSNGAPRSGYANTITGNTTLMANQIFKDSEMLHEASYPNKSTQADLMLLATFRHRSQTTNNFAYTSISDTGLPNSSSVDLTGATLIAHGWFRPHTRTISSHTGTTINYSNISGNNDDGQKYRQWYRVVGKLGLLTAANEWFYDPSNSRLYVWQTGGGSPTGIEYKARNWGFDLRGVDRFTIRGLHFIGCDPAHGDASTDDCVIDNIRAKYMNHDVTLADAFPGYGNCVTSATTSGVPQMGTKLMGINNIVKNSEFQYSASSVIWVGTSGRIENNLFQDISYDGAWGAPASFWGLSDNVVITRNTFERTGRSGVDMGYSYTGNTQPLNANIEVSYNKFTKWGMLNVDLGAIYSWGFRDLTGSTYHHNWFYDDGVVEDPTGRKIDGGQRGIYFDQGTGPVVVHHNVLWNCFTDSSVDGMQDSQDIYSQMEFTGGDGYHRNSGGNFFYNNSILSKMAHHSYATYETNGTKDVFRNNIFRKIINLEWGLAGSGYNANEQYNIFDGERTNITSMASGTGTLKNQDLENNFFSETGGNENGTNGLYYTLHTSSIARNAGVAISGITPDGDSAPDVGAYEFGDDWEPGYNSEAVDEDVWIENNNLTFTTYSVTPTIQSSGIYHGGSASYTNTDQSTITVTFTGTGFEYYAEEYNHAPIIEITVDGVVQDCDTGTGGTQDCDLYVAATTNNSTKIFEKTGMAAGSHTVILKTDGRNASNTTGYYHVYDGLKILE